MNGPEYFIVGFVTAIVVGVLVRWYLMREREIKNFVYKIRDRIFRQ